MRRTFLALGALHLLWAATYAFIMPVGKAPDEPSHFKYVKFVATKLRLPLYDDPEVGHESQQPPLHYFLSAPVFLLTSPLGETAQNRALRLFASLLGLGTLYLTLLTASLLGLSKWGKWAAGLWVGLLPHMLLVSAMVNNDSTTTLTVTAGVTTLTWVALLGPSTVRALICGMATGLALASKQTGLLLLPLWPLAWAVGAKKAGLTPRTAIKSFALGAIIATIVPLPWFVRNLWLYGSLYLYAAHPYDHSLLDLLSAPKFLLELLWIITRDTYRTFWAEKVWFPEALAPWLVGGFSFALLIGVYGWLKRPRAGPEWLVPLGALLLGLLGLYRFNLFISIGAHQGGKYLMPVLPCFALLWAKGGEALPSGARNWALAGLFTLLLVANIVSAFNIVTYLNVVYGG
ncbi:MAG TPA: hypothetical protein EYP65_03490 [Armatimonadetes bacterium]|nr:hypothetical protein [Armatimonadota bacterium]